VKFGKRTLNFLKFPINIHLPFLERILTMVYVVQKSQNFSGLFPSSCIRKNTTFRKLDLFPSSGKGWGEDTYSVGPLERSNFRNIVLFGIQDDGKSPEKFYEFCTPPLPFKTLRLTNIIESIRCWKTYILKHI
jgi:hypothetical protein